MTFLAMGKEDMMDETMFYRGYEGSIEWSEEDGLWFGCVLDIDASVTYEGEDIPALRADFEDAVETYLEHCI